MRDLEIDRVACPPAKRVPLDLPPSNPPRPTVARLLQLLLSPRKGGKSSRLSCVHASPNFRFPASPRTCSLNSERRPRSPVKFNTVLSCHNFQRRQLPTCARAAWIRDTVSGVGFASLLRESVESSATFPLTFKWELPTRFRECTSFAGPSFVTGGRGIVFGFLRTKLEVEALLRIYGYLVTRVVTKYRSAETGEDLDFEINTSHVLGGRM